jgi:hypothetical protein
MDFYHNWTNSILQQLKRNVCKIADSLFLTANNPASRMSRARKGYCTQCWGDLDFTYQHTESPCVKTPAKVG